MIPQIIYLFFVIFLWSLPMNPLLGQQNRASSANLCNGSLLIPEDNEMELPLFYTDFLKQNKQKLMRGDMAYLRRNTKGLIRIAPALLSAHDLRYGDWENTKSKIKVSILLKEEVIPKFSNPGNYPWSPFLDFVDSLGFTFYGQIDFEKDLQYKALDSLILYFGSQKIIVPDSLFRDLFNPNVSDHFRLYKPIEVYWDSKNSLVSIYIIGKMEVYYFPRYDEFQYSPLGSFVARIDVSNQGVCSRIVIPTVILHKYGWNVCPKFWPF